MAHPFEADGVNPHRFSASRPSVGRIPLQDLNIISNYDEEATGTATTASTSTMMSKRRVSFNNKFNVKEFNAEERTAHILLAPEYEEPLSCLSSDSSCQQQTYNSGGSIIHNEFVEHSQVSTTERMEVCLSDNREQFIEKEVVCEQLNVYSNHQRNSDRKVRRKSMGSYSESVMESSRITSSVIDVEQTMAFSPFIDASTDKSNNSSMDVDITDVANSHMPPSNGMMQNVNDVSCDESDMSLTKSVPGDMNIMANFGENSIGAGDDASDMSITKVTPSLRSSNVSLVSCISSVPPMNNSNGSIASDLVTSESNASDMSFTKGFPSGRFINGSDLSLTKDLSTLRKDNANNVNIVRRATSSFGRNSNSDMSITRGAYSSERNSAIDMSVSADVPSFQNYHRDDVSSTNDITSHGCSAVDMSMASRMPSVTKDCVGDINASKDASGFHKSYTTDSSVTTGVMSMTGCQNMVTNASDTSTMKASNMMSSGYDMSMSRGSTLMNSTGMIRDPLMANTVNEMSMTRAPTMSANATYISKINNIPSVTNLNACGMSITGSIPQCSNANTNEPQDILVESNNSRISFEESVHDDSNCGDTSCISFTVPLSNIMAEKTGNDCTRKSLSNRTNELDHINNDNGKGGLTTNESELSCKNDMRFDEVFINKENHEVVRDNSAIQEHDRTNQKLRRTFYENNDNTMNFSFTEFVNIQFHADKCNSFPLDLTKLSEKEEEKNKNDTSLMKQNYTEIGRMEEDICENDIMLRTGCKLNNLSCSHDVMPVMNEISHTNSTFNINISKPEQFPPVDNLQNKTNNNLEVISYEDNNADNSMSVSLSEDKSLSQSNTNSKLIIENQVNISSSVVIKDTSLYGRKISSPEANSNCAAIENLVNERFKDNDDNISKKERCEYQIKNLQINEKDPSNFVFTEMSRAIVNMPTVDKMFPSNLASEIRSDTSCEKSSSTGSTVKECNDIIIHMEVLPDESFLKCGNAIECNEISDNNSHDDNLSNNKDVDSRRQLNTPNCSDLNEQDVQNTDLNDYERDCSNHHSGFNSDVDCRKLHEHVSLNQDKIQACVELPVEAQQNLNKGNQFDEKTINSSRNEMNVSINTSEKCVQNLTDFEPMSTRGIIDSSLADQNSKDLGCSSNDKADTNNSIILSNDDLMKLDLTSVTIRKHSFRKTSRENETANNTENLDDEARILITDVLGDDVKEREGESEDMEGNCLKETKENQSAVQQSYKGIVPAKRKSAESFVSDDSDNNELESPLKIPRNEGEIIEDDSIDTNFYKSVDEINPADSENSFRNENHANHHLNPCMMETVTVSENPHKVNVVAQRVLDITMDMDMDTSATDKTFVEYTEIIKGLASKRKFPFSNFDFRLFDDCTFKYLADNEFSWLFFDGVLNLSVETYPEDDNMTVKSVKMLLNEPDEDDEYTLYFARNVMEKFANELQKFENTNDVSPLLRNVINYIEQKDELFAKLSKYFNVYPLHIIEGNKLLYEVVSAKNLWFKVTMSDKIIFQRISDAEITFKNIIGSTSLADVQHLLRMCSHPLENQLITFLNLLQDFSKK